MAKINDQLFSTKKQQLNDLIYLREEGPDNFGLGSISLGPLHKKYFTYDQKTTDDNQTQEISIVPLPLIVMDITGNIWGKEKKFNQMLSFMTENFGYETNFNDWEATYHKRSHYQDPIDLRPQEL